MPIQYSVDEGLNAFLDVEPISDLLHASSAGFRLYELFRLSGPEELIRYVDAVVQSNCPQRYGWWPRGCWEETGTSQLRGPALDPILFPAPPASALSEASARAAVRWSEIETVRERCHRSNDPLVQTELALIAAGHHPNDLLLETLKPEARVHVQRHFRLRYQTRFPDSTYSLIAELLARPEVLGYAQRGVGDLALLKLVCREQVRRADGTLRSFGDSPFPLRILGRFGGPSYEPDTDELLSLDPYPAWTRQVRWQFEGLGVFGLLFDEGGYGGLSHGEMEASELNSELVAILTTYDDDHASAERAWFKHGSGLNLGLAPQYADNLRPLVVHHGFMVAD